jgi:hypothetical protein
MYASRPARDSAGRMSMTPAAIKRFVASETKKWCKMVKFAGIKAGMSPDVIR